MIVLSNITGSEKNSTLLEYDLPMCACDDICWQGCVTLFYQECVIMISLDPITLSPFILAHTLEFLGIISCLNFLVKLSAGHVSIQNRVEK